MSRTVDPISPIYLDYLRDSAICKISPGFRPGGFLNPYTTTWGRVNVPLLSLLRSVLVYMGSRRFV
jgi:hypothetical protein